MRILTVVGARPQFVKAAVVSRALASHPGVEELLVHTGQHYDASLSDIFFAELGLSTPVRNLAVGSGSHGVQTGRMLERLEAVMVSERPDWVIVYGDTNSTLAAALAAAKLGLRVAHVEAGLRSFQRTMPEEINRVVADRLSDLLFVPTATAVDNLAREGIRGDHVRLVGDVMFDAARAFRPQANNAALLERLDVAAGHYVLATIHRAENTDVPARLADVLTGLRALAAKRPVILPMHPRTRAAIAAADLTSALEGLRVIEPLGYLDMLAAVDDAALVVTDSGGVQKEAFFFGTPCLILRRETEWVELVEGGYARLVEPTDLSAAADEDWAKAPKNDAAARILFGGGQAGTRIAAALCGLPENAASCAS